MENRATELNSFGGVCLRNASEGVVASVPFSLPVGAGRRRPHRIYVGDGYRAPMDGSDRRARDVRNARRRNDDGGSEWEEVLGYVPVTVLSVVVFAGVFTALGVRPVEVVGGGFLFEVSNFLQVHVLNMLMHRGAEHYFVNMLLLVLFGGVLTLLTTNGHTAFVMVAAHVSASVHLTATTGETAIGSSLAIAGVVVATFVRTAALPFVGGGMELGERLLVGVVAVVVVSLYAVTSVTGTLYLPVTDHHLGGWVFGALAEVAWMMWVGYRRG
jgi:hypothetical protein